MTLIVTARCVDCLGVCQKALHANGWLCRKITRLPANPGITAEHLRREIWEMLGWKSEEGFDSALRNAGEALRNAKAKAETTVRQAEEMSGLTLAPYQREMLRNALIKPSIEPLAEQDPISSAARGRINQACQDPLIQAAWERFTAVATVEEKLDDALVFAFLRSTDLLLSKARAERKAQTRNLRRTFKMLVNAASELVERFPEAQVKGDLVYMSDTVEEIDALLADVEEIMAQQDVTTIEDDD